MLSLEDGTTAVRFARSVLESVVKGTSPTHPRLGNAFSRKHGAFVTLLTEPDRDLRGCIGIPSADYPLHDALAEAASSVVHDPRFPPVRPEELASLVVEVTVLSPPIPLRVKIPQELLSTIKVGRDGLIIEQGRFRGLLLPQVPVEQGWDVEEFLANTCMKAGLSPDAWLLPQTTVYTFTGQIFFEQTPGGTVKEKTLHGLEH